MNIIRKAVERLPGHWYQGGLVDNEGNMCGIGHVYTIANWENRNDNNDYNDARIIMADVAKEQYPDRMSISCDPFAAFNDHPDTTEDEVIAVMEKAAVRLDERV